MASPSTVLPSIDDLKTLFSPFDVRNHPEKYTITNLHKIAPAKQASVLVPLFYKNGNLHVLLTLRSTNMSNHAGQVAFPGGMKDASDTNVIETAIRETEEEVGIMKDKINVISVLPSVVMSSLTVVTPVLAVLSDDFVVVPNPREVSLVFDLPLKRFLSKKGLSISFFRAKHEYVMYHFEDQVEDKRVNTWGFTGFTCLKVAMVALQSDTEIQLYRNRSLGKDDCFSVEGTIAFVDFMAERQAAKL